MGNLLTVLNNMKDAPELKSVDKDTVITTRDDIEVISTGSIIIDKLLGRPGVGRGRLTEIYGLESSGKCQPKSVYLKTKYGIVTIEEIFNRNNINPSCTCKEVECEDTFMNEKGEYENTTHFTCNNRKPVFKIKTELGNEVEATYNHPLRVIDKNGFIIWKNTGEIESGDYLISCRFYDPNLEEFSEEEFHECRLLGRLVADGCFSDFKRIVFSNGDFEVIDQFHDDMEKVFKIDRNQIKFYPRENSKSIEHQLNCMELTDPYYKKYSIQEGLAESKMIPYLIRTGTLYEKKIFIQSYMDIESYLEENCLEVISASKELLMQLKLLLQLDFGIISALNEKPVKLEGWEDYKIYYRLIISGQNLRLYVDRIGFGTKEKLDKLQFIKDDFRTASSSVPNAGKLLDSLYNSLSISNREVCSLFVDYIGEKPRANLTKKQWEKILQGIGEDGDTFIKGRISKYFEDDLFFDRVSSKEYSGDKPTFDFAMSKSASFISNGVCSHNTTVALHICREVQKATKGNVCFADFEQAIDINYSNKGIGVDTSPERFVLLQPITLEEGCEVIFYLLEHYSQSKIDCLVIDSIKAMTPKSILEGQLFDEPMVAIQARKIGTFITKLSKIVRHTKTTVILLNQMSKNIKMSPFQSGGEYETPGGLAPRFFASTRIELKKEKVLSKKLVDDISNKEEEVPYINVVRASITKNKIGNPYRKATFSIEFGKGIDNRRDIILMALAHNIIQRQGGWYTYREDSKDGFKLNGESALLEHLKKNEYLLSEIADKLYFKQDLEVVEMAKSEEVLDLAAEKKFNDKKVVKKKKDDLLEIK